jgi:hypothetical protein
MGETTKKLDVLSLLSQEFFDELRKKDENSVLDHFGNPLGRLLIRHSILEDKYATLAADQMNAVPNPEGEQEDPVTE